MLSRPRPTAQSGPSKLYVQLAPHLIICITNQHQELAFLTDASVMSPDQLSSILTQLPTEQEMNAPIPLQTEPVAQKMSNLNVNGNEKNGYPSPQPSPMHQPPPAYPSAPSPPAAVLTYATALYAYKPSDAGDLELQQRDRIAVTEYMNAEWWKGRSERTGEEGIFPRSYVEVEKKTPAPTLPGRTQSETNYGNMPVEVSQSGGSATPGPGQKSKFEEGGKKFGKKMVSLLDIQNVWASTNVVFRAMQPSLVQVQPLEGKL